MILLWVECVIHFGIVVVLFSYDGKESRQRWGVSALAVFLAGGNVGLGVLMAFQIFSPGPPIAQLLLIMVLVVILGLLLRAHGNVAKMIPPINTRMFL